MMRNSVSEELKERKLEDMIDIQWIRWNSVLKMNDIMRKEKSTADNDHRS